jgi:DNA-binding beta-propeller fold protein YncE
MARTVSAVLIALVLFPRSILSAGAPRVEETGARLGAGELREPIGIAVDALGFVYVADAMAGKVFRFDAAGGSLELSRPPEQAGFYPIDVAAQESFVFVLDYAGNRLLRYDAKGSYLDVFISFGASGGRPVSITAGAGGRMITTDPVGDTVALWTPLLELELSIGGFGRGAGSFSDPRKAVFLPRQEIVVVESGNRRLQLFSPSGRYLRTAVPPGERGFVSPRYLAADDRGVVVVCDPEGRRLSLFSSSLEHIADVETYGGEPISPAAAAVGWDGDLYVADLASRSVIVYRLVYPDDK